MRLTSLVLFPILLTTAFAAEVTMPAERATNDFVFIDNGALRLGVKKSSGAGIAYLALRATGENVINHWDRGRLVQQSYYGAKDGSMWDKQPWRWNPVQGGDWRGNPARVLEFKAERESLYAKSMGKLLDEDQRALREAVGVIVG